MNTKKWKPKLNEEYYLPYTMYKQLCISAHWDNHIIDIWRYKNNLICKTKTEAIALAKAMLKVAERRGK